MRILGIDYGHVRTGCALSDPTKTFARELDILHTNADLFVQLQELIDEYQVVCVVVGIPRSLKNSNKINKQEAEVRAFILELETHIDLPVEMVDERYTSKMAHDVHKKTGLKKQNVDSLAAVFLLQSYLDQYSS